MAHLRARDVTMLLASRAPLEKLQAYKERMGWGIDWVSTAGSDFNRDLGFTHTEEELRPFLEGGFPDGRADGGGERHGRCRMALAALAVAHEQRAAARVEVVLGERKRLLNAQSARQSTTIIARSRYP